ncbi:MAG TPA: ABC transporter permease [Pyrinomonadaceae bacterium]|nr:ABC transporter permease [Pyrinomonadaceae bacterium]
MGTLWQDIRFSLRLMAKKPGFTFIGVLALALGIGANTAIFSVVQAVLLSPLPYRQSERLVWIWETNPSSDIKEEPASMPNFNDWRTQSQSFEEMAGFTNTAVTLTGDGEPERVRAGLITAGFFSTLGTQPMMGRSFTPEENGEKGARVLILSHGLWQRRFGSNPQVVGQTVTIAGNPYQIVGVMPQDFKDPLPVQRNPSEMWIPLAMSFEPNLRRSDFLKVVARLKPGVTIEQARAEMKTITSRLEQQYPDTNAGWSTLVIPLQERIVGDVRPALWVIVGVVGFLLLIACANVANLLLARSAARQQEIAVRRALGAGRLRLVRQFLTESVMLALAGGVMGALLAMWGVELLTRLGPRDIPRLDEVRLNWMVLAFTLGVSVLTGVIFGLIPALHATNPDLTESLKEGGRSSTEGRRGARLRSALVVAEIAIALVMLVGAGLMVKSFMRLQSVDPGFKPDRILAVDLSLPSTKYKEQAQQLAFWEQFMNRVSQLPGVERVAAANAIPFTGGSILAFSVEGRPPLPPGSDTPDAEHRVVTPGYFDAMNISLVRGSAFTAQHNSSAPAVTLISETMARKYFPNEDPIGKRINLGDPEKSPWLTIIGIVKDVRQDALDKEPYPQMYVPHAQLTSRAMTLLVRTSNSPSSLVPAIRSELANMDKDQPLYNVRTVEQVMSESISRQRFSMLLIAIFAGVGLVLASVGIYGVMSYTVAQRTHEIGVRMALGASARDVLRMVVGQGMLLAATGTVLGLGAAFLLSRFISSLLFNVSAADPLTYVLLSLLLISVALVACLIPALRATRVDPMVALRYE